MVKPRPRGNGRRDPYLNLGLVGLMGKFDIDFKDGYSSVSRWPINYSKTYGPRSVPPWSHLAVLLIFPHSAQSIFLPEIYSYLYSRYLYSGSHIRRSSRIEAFTYTTIRSNGSSPVDITSLFCSPIIRLQ